MKQETVLMATARAAEAGEGPQDAAQLEAAAVARAAAAVARSVAAGDGPPVYADSDSSNEGIRAEAGDGPQDAAQLEAAAVARAAAAIARSVAAGDGPPVYADSDRSSEGISWNEGGSCAVLGSASESEGESSREAQGQSAEERGSPAPPPLAARARNDGVAPIHTNRHRSRSPDRSRRGDPFSPDEITARAIKDAHLLSQECAAIRRR